MNRLEEFLNDYIVCPLDSVRRRSTIIGSIIRAQSRVNKRCMMEGQNLDDEISPGQRKRVSAAISEGLREWMGGNYEL